jgi:intracellular multiplication protein IcmK
MMKQIKQLHWVILLGLVMLICHHGVVWADTNDAASSASFENNSLDADSNVSREAMISQLLDDAVNQQQSTVQDASDNANNQSSGASQTVEAADNISRIKSAATSSGTFEGLRNMSNAMFTGRRSSAGSSAGSASVASTEEVSNTVYRELQNQAFSNMTRGMMPLTPQQIQQLHNMYNTSRRAAASHPGTPPKPTSSSIVPDLSPGATPPVIRLSQGFITSLVVLDVTGEPWPIRAVDVGDPRSFNVQWDHKGNTLLMQSLSGYKSTNLAIIVKGLTTPVMFTLLPGQTAVDYRVDVRVPRLGPNANPNLIRHIPASSNQQLLNTLDGIPPTNSRELQAVGGDAKVWEIGGRLYLRTQMTLLSPSWIATISSGDGTNAYLLQASPILLALDHGKIVQLEIKGL